MPLFNSKIHRSANPSVGSQPRDQPFFGVQTKLSIGKENDRFEQEADKVADQVVQNENRTPLFGDTPFIQKSAPPISQLKPEPESASENSTDQETQTDPSAEKNTGVDLPEDSHGGEAVPIQEKSSGKQGSTDQLEIGVNASKGGGQAMEPTTKQEMESGFGRDFSSVRLHTDSNAVQMSKDLGAQAFTHKNNIYFNEGKYQPDTEQGKHLLAHELTHTVQQGATDTPSVQSKLNSSVPDIQEDHHDEDDQGSDLTSEPTDESENSEQNNGDQNDEDQNNDENNGDQNDGSSNRNDQSQNSNTVPQNGTTNNANNNSIPSTNAQSAQTSSNNLSSNLENTSEQDPEQNESLGETNLAERTGESLDPFVPINHESALSGGDAEGGFPTWDTFITYVTTKKAAVQALFVEKRQAITDLVEEEKTRTRDAIQTEITRLEQTRTNSIAQIDADYLAATDGIRTKRDEEITYARELADTEIARVDEIILEKKRLAIESGEAKARSVLDTASEESNRVDEVTETSVREVSTIIRQKTNAYSSRENADDVSKAAWESRPTTEADLRESGRIIRTSISEHASGLAGNYREDAQNFADGFNDSDEESKTSIRERRDETITGLQDAAQESLDALATETQNLKNELNRGVDQNLTVLQALPARTDAELDDIARIVNERLTTEETTILGEIDQFKSDLETIYWHRDEVAEAQIELEAAIEEHLTEVNDYISEVGNTLRPITSGFRDEMKEAQDRVLPSIEEAASTYGTTANQLRVDTVSGLNDLAREAETGTISVADQLDSGLQEQLNEKETEWNSQLTEDVTAMREKVSEGLLEQAEILGRFSENLDEEFNRTSSWWDDVVNFLDGMIDGIVEGFTALVSALWDAMGTLLFWIIVIIIVIVILVLVFVFDIALAAILGVLAVIGLVIGIIAFLYYLGAAIFSEGLTPYQRGKLFGRGVFELAFALIGTGVYARLFGWIPRISKIAAIVARVGSWSRFLRIVVKVQNVRAFVQLIDRIQDIEQLLILMERIKHFDELVVLLNSLDDFERVMSIIARVEKADELIMLLTRAENVAQIVAIVERAAIIGKADSVILLLGKAREMAKIILLFERSGDDIGQMIRILEEAPDLNKAVVALERLQEFSRINQLYTRLGGENFFKLLSNPKFTRATLAEIDEVIASQKILSGADLMTLINNQKIASFTELVTLLRNTKIPNSAKLIQVLDETKFTAQTLIRALESPLVTDIDDVIRLGRIFKNRANFAAVNVAELLHHPSVKNLADLERLLSLNNIRGGTSQIIEALNTGKIDDIADLTRLLETAGVDSLADVILALNSDVVTNIGQLRTIMNSGDVTNLKQFLTLLERGVLTSADDLIDALRDGTLRSILESIDAAVHIPGIRNGEFATWFNSLNAADLTRIMSNAANRATMGSRIRHPGGMHEWLMVSKCPRVRSWGVTIETIWDLRNGTNDIRLTNRFPPPRDHGSGLMHQELAAIIDNSGSLDDFATQISAWARTALVGGINDLPAGLRRP